MGFGPNNAAIAAALDNWSRLNTKMSSHQYKKHVKDKAV